MMGLLFFYFVADAEAWSTTDPADIPAYTGPQHHILRFAAALFVMILMALAQYLFQVLYYQRYVENKMTQFVDLCSLSNISVFIMSHPLFGFYIHGRSVHGRADTDMWEMNSQLRKEEEDLTGRRGLLPEDDRQTFEMHLAPKLRDDYDRIMADFATAPQRGMHSKRTRGCSDQSIHTHAKIARMLSTFLDHAYRNLDYCVKDKLFMERLLGNLPQVMEQSIFYSDHGHSFDAVLFFGNEFALFAFESVLFGIIDYGSDGNVILAIVLTWVIQFILRHVRNVGSKKNLARKTLVDERFLI